MDLQEISPIFIGGAGRSGTTLMRVILNSHKNICIGPEIKIIGLSRNLWEKAHSDILYEVLNKYKNNHTDINKNFANLVYGFIEKFHKESGKSRWGEKTPQNIHHLEYIFSIFPNARFIHLIRDGRDVACSLINKDWFDLETGGKVWYTQNIKNATEYWASTIYDAREFINSHPGINSKYCEIRYENLINSPEKTIRELMIFLDESFDPMMLNHQNVEHNLIESESSTAAVKDPINKKALSRWKQDMNAKDKEECKSAAGELLINLGYANDNMW